MALTDTTSPSAMWTDDELLANVRKVIQTFMTMRDVDMTELASMSGMKRSTLYNRFNGKSPDFTGPELWRIAGALEFAPGLFFESAPDLLRSRCFAPLALVTDMDPPTLFDDDTRADDEATVRRRAFAIV